MIERSWEEWKQTQKLLDDAYAELAELILRNKKLINKNKRFKDLKWRMDGLSL